MTIYTLAYRLHETQAELLEKERNPIEVWTECVNRIDSRFMTLIGHRDDPAGYIDSICAQYIEDCISANIEHHVCALESMQSSLFRYQDEILTLEGVGAVFNGSDKVLSKVKQLLGWVEEIYGVALFSSQEFRELFKKREFEYQKV